MTEKIEGIILNVRKHNDRNNIVTLYTRNRGRLSFISPDGNGKTSNARRARLQPLALISTEFNYKPSSDLQRLGSFTLSEVWQDIYFHPVKRSITFFLSEFLYRLLNATMPDPEMYDFIVDSIRLLDRSEKKIADFNIPFLVSLLPLSGIQPDISGFLPGKVFDIHSGTFLWKEETSGPVLSEYDSQFVKLVSRINFSNIKRLRLDNTGRRKILYSLLNYYSYHFPGISSLKTPEVLRDLLY